MIEDGEFSEISFPEPEEPPQPKKSDPIKRTKQTYIIFFIINKP
jgi:hypothetical protein